MYTEIKLESKRNMVTRIVRNDKSYVHKTFNKKDDMKKEVEVLSVLHSAGINVPEIIEIKDNGLFLEDLGDNTLLRWYESLEKEDSYDYENMLLKLCQWLKSFYYSTFSRYSFSYILWDVNFRNFIIFDNTIYGIDFEQSTFGNIETDAGRLLAFALTYAPAMTEWKIEFHDKLLCMICKELKLKKDIVLLEEKKELEAIKQRRNEK